MESEDDKVVTTDPEKTTPNPEVAPPAVEPHPDNSLKDAVAALQSKVDELGGIVTGILESGHGARDEAPVKKPWTHRGSGR